MKIAQVLTQFAVMITHVAHVREITNAPHHHPHVILLSLLILLEVTVLDVLMTRNAQLILPNHTVVLLYKSASLALRTINA